MKNLFITSVMLAIFGLSANAQTLSWHKNWNSNGGADKAYAVAYDAAGNVYVTGQANFGGSSTTYIETIKYSKAGVQQWATSCSGAGNTQYQIGVDIAVDATGYVWVAGSTSDGSGKTHLALIKYSASTGAVLTSQGFPKIDNCTSGTAVWPRGTCLAVADSGDVYIGGSTFDGTNWNIIVLKNDPNSTGWKWSYTYPSFANTTQAEATDLKVSGSALLVAGNYFAGSTNHEDIVVASLNTTTGLANWTPVTWNSSANKDDFARAMTTDGKNIYVCGYTTNSSSVEEGLLLSLPITGGAFNYASTYTDPYSGYKANWNAIDIKLSSDIIFVGGFEQVNSNPAENYILGAYVASTGALYSSWGTNPIPYNGGQSTDPAGTNEGWAVSYEPTTDWVYICGRSDTMPGGINITTIGYSVSNGHHVWEANFDYNYDVQANMPDRIFCKYSMKSVYATCSVDNIYVTGESWVTNDSYDYITLQYGYNGPGCDIEGSSERHASTSDNMPTGFYPNPFTTTATLELSPETTINNAVLSVYDISGRLVSNVKNITSTDISINRGNLKNGLYYYTLSDNGTIITRGKFIIAEE
jgi:hypothetical protein